MLLVDDILLSPMHGVLWIFRAIHNAARQELANEPEEITRQLRLLYMQLETGKISEADFEAEERRLLDHLDEVQDSSAIAEEPVGSK